MTLERLDAADPASLERFERAFHAAFSRAKANRLARRLWHWDDTAGRIRPRIPYDDQHVYLRWQDDGDVETAVAINWRLAKYQAALLGFPAPPAGLRGHCEILALFSQRDADLVGLRTFLREVAALLLQAGFESADATSTDRLLPVYEHIGGQPLEQRCLDGENRTLLRFPLQQVARLQALT
jgi:hypothetical protein